MGKIFSKKADYILYGSAKDTLGFTKNIEGINPIFEDFLIKIYDFYSPKQLDDIKKQLMNRKILIIDAKKILENKNLNILELKRLIDDLKVFLSEVGGSLGRLGDQYLILTPNSYIKISN
ncbi:MAG: cell division protein SepF [Candidatus Lokiarchaeota archaeon]|nr:cell division protein SepF [Candidatus Lokiarchaeota archaeon]